MIPTDTAEACRTVSIQQMSFYLWPPCVADADIIIFVLWFLLTFCLSSALDRPSNKYNCVQSNAGLSSAITETGNCTSLKSDFYLQFHSPLNTKSALLNFICTWDLMLMCWQMCSPEPENSRNRNPHTSNIGELLPVCLTNNRRLSDHISEPHAKFGENR